MRRKGKILFGVVIWMLMMLGMVCTARADVILNESSFTWSENSTIDHEVEIIRDVKVSNNITLTIPAGKRLTVHGGIDAMDHTLTVTGEGELIVTGKADMINAHSATGLKGDLIVEGAVVCVQGGKGNDADSLNVPGDSGCNGVYGNVTINSGSVTVSGGDGGKGGDGFVGAASGLGVYGDVIINGGSATVIGGDGGDGGDGGRGGNGENGVYGNVTVNSGSATVIGGDGGKGGNGGDGGKGGNGGDGVCGNVTIYDGSATISGGNGVDGGHSSCGVSGNVTIYDGSATISGGKGGNSDPPRRGPAASGIIIGENIDGSNDNSNWTPIISGNACTYIYIRRVVNVSDIWDPQVDVVTVTINPVDKTKLNQLIQAAQDYYKAIKDKYSTIASALKIAIDEAKEVSNNNNTDISTVSEAITKVSVAKAEAAQKVAEADKKAAENKANQAQQNTLAPLAQTCNVKVKGGKKKATVRWKAVSGAQGYEILVSKNKKGTKIVKTVKAKRTKKVIKKLGKGKYFIKVRAWKSYKGNTVYGKYSKAKKVKVK